MAEQSRLTRIHLGLGDHLGSTGNESGTLSILPEVQPMDMPLYINSSPLMAGSRSVSQCFKIQVITSAFTDQHVRKGEQMRKLCQLPWQEFHLTEARRFAAKIIKHYIRGYCENTTKIINHTANKKNTDEYFFCYKLLFNIT